MRRRKRRSISLPCECGCGGWAKAGNKFIHGHNIRGDGNPSKRPEVRAAISRASASKKGPLSSNWSGDPVTIFCKQCGKGFEVRPHRKAIFCSRQCHYKWASENFRGNKRYNYKTKVEKACEYCGITFLALESENKKFCSRKCKYKWASENFRGDKIHNYVGRIKINCEGCGKELEVLSNATTRFCSVECMAQVNAKDKERNEKISETVRKLWQDTEYRDKQLSDENQINRAKAWEGKFQDPEFCKMWVRTHGIKPNKLELKFNTFLQELFPDEYKYVGDFQYFIGGKNPDFANVNGQKKLIEVFGDYWHSEEVVGLSREEAEQDKIDHFKQYGFDTLVVWEDEFLNNESLIKEKLQAFHQS